MEELSIKTYKENTDEFFKLFESVNTEVAFDLETSGLEPEKDEILLASFYWGDDIHILESDFDKIPEHKKYIYHNAKFDWKFMYIKTGLDLDIYSDTMVLWYNKDPANDVSLEDVGKAVGYEKISFEKVFGKKVNFRDCLIFDRDKTLQYAGNDAFITLKIYEAIKQYMQEPLYEVDMQLIKSVAMSELRGITLDIEYFDKQSIILTEQIEALEIDIINTLNISNDENFELNLNSPQQLGQALYVYGVPLSRLTASARKPKKVENINKKKITEPKQQYATGEEVLKKYMHFPVIKKVLHYKALNKLKNSFFDKLPILLDKEHKLHCNFKTCHTVTGRFASSDPNLQQLPNPDKTIKKTGTNIRSGFLPCPGYYFLGADFNQIEFRMFASECRDVNLLKSYAEGLDAHTMTASLVYNLPYNEITKEQRSYIKAINFGLIYGMSAWGLADQLNISKEQAQSLMDTYFKRIPKAQQWMDRVVKKVMQDGYITSKFGRRRYISEINSTDNKTQKSGERMAINSAIQMSAADVMRIALARLYNALKGRDVKMDIYIHDEFIFEISEKENLKEICKIIKNAMIFDIKDYIPMAVEFEKGYTWGDLQVFNPFEDEIKTTENLNTEEVNKPIIKNTAEIETKSEKQDILYPSIFIKHCSVFNEDIEYKLYDIIKEYRGSYFLYLHLNENEFILIKNKVCRSNVFFDRLKDIFGEIEYKIFEKPADEENKILDNLQNVFNKELSK